MAVLKYLLQGPLWLLNLVILGATIYLYFTQAYPTQLATPIFLLIIDILYIIGRVMKKKRRSLDVNNFTNNQTTDKQL